VGRWRPRIAKLERVTTVQGGYGTAHRRRQNQNTNTKAANPAPLTHTQRPKPKTNVQGPAKATAAKIKRPNAQRPKPTQPTKWKRNEEDITVATELAGSTGIDQPHPKTETKITVAKTKRAHSGAKAV
jgi:hypothetical protein